jgi:iron complex transport system substrate-binding protein
MKKYIILIFSLLLCASFLSCADEKTDEKVYYSFKDSEQRDVILEKKPQKVAVLFSSYAEMWTLAGGDVSITVGESVERGFADANTVLVDSGAGKTIDREILIASAPDFVIASADIAAQAELAGYLDSVGIPCALFRVDSFYDYADVMDDLCKITERDDLYEKNVTKIADEIENILNSVDKSRAPRIIFVRCGSSASSTKAKNAEENFVCKMIAELGGVNIADEAPELCDGLSLEAILTAQPEKMLISTMGNEQKSREYMDSVLKSEPWQALGAVKNQDYVYLGKELFQFKPNARWAEAYKFLAEYLYGEG